MHSLWNYYSIQKKMSILFELLSTLFINSTNMTENNETIQKYHKPIINKLCIIQQRKFREIRKQKLTLTKLNQKCI